MGDINSAYFHKFMMEKTPKGIRIAEIILGAITIALAAFVISSPDTTTVILVMLLGLSLIFTGIARIIVGGVAKQISKGYRAINIAIGVISIVGGIFAIANPITAVATLIWIVSIFILIHGLGLIASGIVSRGVDKGSRFSGIVLGGIAVAFASILLAYPGLALVMMIIFLSLGLLFNGIASVVSGITGNRIMQPLSK
jgi:hypothetical protein